MERVFKSETWNKVREDFGGKQSEIICQILGRSMMPTIGYFLSDYSTCRYSTVFPRYDLFCFQPHDLVTLGWDRIPFDVSWGSN